MRPPPVSTPFPYTTLFRSPEVRPRGSGITARPRPWGESPPSVSGRGIPRRRGIESAPLAIRRRTASSGRPILGRSEEHTSELQSRFDLVCRLLLEKKEELL